MNGSVDPLPQTRPVVGKVMSMPCSNPNCPNLEVISDDDWSVQKILELYENCIVSVTVTYVSGPHIHERRP